MTREIRLSRGLVALVDDADFDAVNRFRWHAQPHRATFYAVRNLPRSEGRRSTERLHRFLAGHWAIVDHINGNGLDNRRANLRPATNAENCANRPGIQGTSSVFKGVSWMKRNRKWAARIGHSGRQRHLGLFADEEEAARAYDAAARDLFHDFAWLNFPESEPQS